MKAALLCELATIRSLIVQLAALILVIGVIVSIATESSIAMVSCIAAMTPFLVVFTLSGYDATNGWERFRACLPLSRNAVVFGRYATVLLTTIILSALAIGVALVLAYAAPTLPLPETAAENLALVRDPLTFAAAALAGAGAVLLPTALILPFVLRFGMTKAIRIVPIVMMLLLVVSVSLLIDAANTLAGATWMGDLIAFVSDEANLLVLMAIIAAIVLVVYAISFAVATRLYRSKDL